MEERDCFCKDVSGVVEFIDINSVMPGIEPNVEETLVDSISRFGFDQPIVIDRDKKIVDGTRRYFAAKRLGWPVVPIVYL